MSKHKKKAQLQQNPQTVQPAQAQGAQPGQAEVPAVPVPAEDAVTGGAPAVPRAYFFSFWGLIIAALALAWALAAYMPQVPEYVVERWIMAGLAAALAILLIIFK